MLRLLDHTETHLLQKVLHGAMVVGYQVVPKNRIGDSRAIKRFDFLTEARQEMKEATECQRSKPQLAQ